MSDETQLWQLRDPPVACEDVDGEVVLIDLENGTYYSLRDAAAVAFRYLAGGRPRGEAVAALDAAFEGGAERLGEGLDQLRQALVTARLLVPRAEGQAPVEVPEAGGAKAPVKHFTLEAFTDMQELLVLDPIHEIEASGWPAARPAEAEAETKA